MWKFRAQIKIFRLFIHKVQTQVFEFILALDIVGVQPADWKVHWKILPRYFWRKARHSLTLQLEKFCKLFTNRSSGVAMLNTATTACLLKERRQSSRIKRKVAFFYIDIAASFADIGRVLLNLKETSQNFVEWHTSVDQFIIWKHACTI